MGDRTPAFPSDHGDLMRAEMWVAPSHKNTTPDPRARRTSTDSRERDRPFTLSPQPTVRRRPLVGAQAAASAEPARQCGCGQRRGECEQRAARTSCVGVCVGLGACPACGPWSFRFPSCALWQWWATFGVSEGVACRWGTSNISESCAKSSPCSDKTNSIRSRSGESR